MQCSVSAGVVASSVYCIVLTGGRDKRRNGLILVTVDHFEVHVFRLPHLFVDHVKTAVEHELFDDGVHAGVRLRET